MSRLIFFVTKIKATLAANFLAMYDSFYNVVEHIIVIFLLQETEVLNFFSIRKKMLSI